MENLNELLDKPARFLALTSLTKEEFLAILSKFSVLWKDYYQRYDLKGVKRKCPKFKEDARISLKGADNKLFFILLFIKNNSLEEMIGTMFDLTQGKVSQWIRLLLPILEDSLTRMDCMPAKTQEALRKSIEASKNKELFFLIDVTDREVPRNIDYEAQKVEYTGKNKMHAGKNLLLTEKSTYIQYVSPTYEGSRHDKAILDENPLTGLPDMSTLAQDLGFLGHSPENISIMMPEKKPKGKELTKEQKESNKQISKVRVLVEHAIAGVKRLRIIKDKIRLKIEGVRDTVMYVACALHNLRVRNRNPNFSS